MFRKFDSLFDVLYVSGSGLGTILDKINSVTAALKYAPLPTRLTFGYEGRPSCGLDKGGGRNNT
jgi:hypothetical protein